MPFASYYRWMCLLASCGLAGLPGSGCIATDRIEFVPTENFPPSVVSQTEATYPLNEIGLLNLDDPPPDQGAEVRLETIVRDPNLDDTLEFRIFLDSPPEPDIPLSAGTIEPSGFIERERDFVIPFERLTPGVCHRIELVVVGEFASFAEPRRPVVPGDFDDPTWWIRVVDTDNPTATECQ
ncbi:MAG: hypothetical protein AAF500_16750 [Myxococcota bacterium]